MKATLLSIILAVLVITSVACDAQKIIPIAKWNSISDFPLPGKISDFTKLSDDMLTFNTDMSVENVLAFYRGIFIKEGYTERTKVTYSTKTDFGIVFDGDPSGKEIIVQGADVEGGLSTVTIRFRDIDNEDSPK